MYRINKTISSMAHGKEFTAGGVLYGNEFPQYALDAMLADGTIEIIGAVPDEELPVEVEVEVEAVGPVEVEAEDQAEPDEDVVEPDGDEPEESEPEDEAEPETDEDEPDEEPRKKGRKK